MSEMTPQRRKVALLGASLAMMSVAGTTLFKGHPGLKMAWLGLMLVTLVYAVVKFVKLKRSER